MRFRAVKVGMMIGMLAATPGVFAAGYTKTNNTNNTSRKPAQQQQPQQPVQPKPAQQPINQSAAANAQKDVATATDELNKANATLTALTAKYRQQKLEPTAPYKEAQAAVTKAQIAYEAAKRGVIDNLKKDPAYQKIVDDRIAAQKEHDALTAESSFDDRARIAKAMMNGADASTKMETAALGADAKTKDAKSAVDAASAKLTEVTSTFDATLKDVPEWATASKAVEDAKQKLESAKTALANAQNQKTAVR